MMVFPRVIVWFRTPGTVPRGYLMLAPTTSVQESPGKGSAIEVISSSGRRLRFRTHDAVTHHGWLSDIGHALTERRQSLANPTSPPTLRRSYASSSSPGSRSSCGSRVGSTPGDEADELPFGERSGRSSCARPGASLGSHAPTAGRCSCGGATAAALARPPHQLDAAHSRRSSRNTSMSSEESIESDEEDAPGMKN